MTQDPDRLQQILTYLSGVHPSVQITFWFVTGGLLWHFGVWFFKPKLKNLIPGISRLSKKT